MLDRKSLQEFTLKVHALTDKKTPSFHVVLGSGFGSALEQAIPPTWKRRGGFSFSEISGIQKVSVPDHAGRFEILEHASGKCVIFQMGRLHGYEGIAPSEVVAPVILARELGVTRFVLTNASGGITAGYNAGDAMIIRDQVNMTGRNPLEGANPLSLKSGEPRGPRFPDMSRLYSPELSQKLKSALEKNQVRVHEGIYLGILGPSFETPAEVQLFSRWGMDAVGMSTVWEAIALGHSGAEICGLSLISNPACGLGDGTPLDHHVIVDACRAAAGKIIRGVFGLIDVSL